MNAVVAVVVVMEDIDANAVPPEPCFFRPLPTPTTPSVAGDTAANGDDGVEAGGGDVGGGGGGVGFTEDGTLCILSSLEEQFPILRAVRKLSNTIVDGFFGMEVFFWFGFFWVDKMVHD